MTHPDGGVTVSFKVAFGRGPRGRKRAAAAPPDPQPKSPSGLQMVAPPPPDSSSIPKITRMLVLGYHFERMVREGVVKDYAEIAKLTGLSRARVTQILNLTLIAPDIQERVLLSSAGLAHKQKVRLRGLWQVAAWSEQHHRWR